MQLLRKETLALKPLERCNAIDSSIDRRNSAYDNIPLMIGLIEKMADIHKNRLKNSEKWSDYANALPKVYIPTATFTWDQETEDRMTINLPHKPIWKKTRNGFVDNMETFEQREHKTIIDAGWNYQMICSKPNPQLTSEQLKSLNDSIIRADDEEGIQDHFKQLRVLYGGVRVHSKDEVGLNKQSLSEQPNVLYGVSVLENLSEELDIVNNIKRPYSYCNKIDYKEQVEESEEEYEPWPPQIKNRPERSEQLLDEWVLSHPPKNRRQICNDPLEEWHSGTDKRLEWLSLSVEEEDNEEKNKDTFGP